MTEMRACKECGKMFMPKGREKYCSDVHYRPCPVCGTPVVAKYLSDPPCKCKDCRGKKMQPASSAKKLFNIDEPKFPNMTIPTIDLAKAIKLEQELKTKISNSNEVILDLEGGVSLAEIKKLPRVTNLFDAKNIDKTKIPAVVLDSVPVVSANAKAKTIKPGLDPEKFCETYDDKVMKYVGPNFGQFENNHNYKIALSRKDNYYLITSCHDVTDNKEVKCFYLASSQLNISNRFAVVE